jgi:exosortase family protein XrtF
VQNNKLIVIFLLKFFGTYAILYLVYAYYLQQSQQKVGVFSCSTITKNVAFQTENLLRNVGYNVETQQNKTEVSMNLFVNNIIVARVVEGCNSMSVIILFISFIVAFSGKFLVTTLYILFGSFLIYALNIVRIAIITIAMYKYPKYQGVLHEVVFPVLIYGLTFLLWFIWVRNFQKNNE